MERNLTRPLSSMETLTPRPSDRLLLSTILPSIMKATPLGSRRERNLARQRQPLRFLQLTTVDRNPLLLACLKRLLDKGMFGRTTLLYRLHKQRVDPDKTSSTTNIPSNLRRKWRLLLRRSWDKNLLPERHSLLIRNLCTMRQQLTSILLRKVSARQWGKALQRLAVT